MELFAHNQTAYDAAVAMLAETGKSAIVHPTGTGKSFIGFKLCEDNPDKTMCWLSPSEYIFKTQIENWKQAGGKELDNILFFTYAKLMLMTEEEISLIEPDYIILDEFHRAGAESWGTGVQTLLDAYFDTPILGLSATSIRYLDNQRNMADELFDGNIASEMTLGEAIVRGILAAPKYVVSLFSYQSDLKNYERRIKDTRSKIVADAAERYLDALRRALDKADGLDVVFDRHMTDRNGKYIVFCANKEHMDEMLNYAGEWFGKIDPDMHLYSAYSSDPETSKAFDSFKKDKSDHLKLLYCIDMLNEGIHVDDISGVILLRPTVSPIVYKQQIGRSLSAGKTTEPVIFDIVNNFESLYSIGAIEDEMKVAITYYRFLGENSEIVQEHFKIIDEVRDCKALFDSLSDTLSASWNLMYQLACGYYREHGDLLPTQNYKTEDGYALGLWISRHRAAYKRKPHISLTEDRIKKLNAIGMEWDYQPPTQWDAYYPILKHYYAEYGNIDINSHTLYEGVYLGQWLIEQKNLYRHGKLPQDKVLLLEKLSVDWLTRHERLWEKAYAIAKAFFDGHGDLNARTDDPALSSWLINQRRKYRDGSIDEEHYNRLSAIGMIWDLDDTWEAAFAEAREYFEAHGNLDIPATYITENGTRIGNWYRSVRNAKRDGTLSAERIKRLEEIGNKWRSVKTRNWMQYKSLPSSFMKSTATS